MHTTPQSQSAVLPISVRVAQCARELGDGDLAALGRMYDFTARRLIRYAETLTRNREDAEDSLQAAMIRVAQNPARLATADHPWAYFLKIIRNEALKIIGRKKPMLTLSGELNPWCADQREVEQAESRAQIRAALQRLPSEQAEIVVLKIWEEMTFLEIAEVLDESHNTAASRYRYALTKLQRYLQPIAREACHD